MRGLTLPSRVFPAILGLLALCPALAADDRVLVPLDAASTDRWHSKLIGAIDDIEQGRFREAIVVLQAALIEGGAPAPAPSSGVDPLEETRKAVRRPNAVLFEVDPGVGLDLKGLRRSLGSPSRAEGRRGDEADEKEGALETPLVARTLPARGGRRYLTLGRMAQAVLSALPPEGLRAYREIHDAVAAGLLGEGEAVGGGEAGAGAGGPEGSRPPGAAAVERVARELFLTSRGDEAAEIAGDALFEAGRYAGAIAWWRKVLEEYPDSDLPAGRLRTKVLYALRALGDEGEYLLERERFLESGGGAAREALEGIERSVPLIPRGERPPPVRSSRWGGDLVHSRPPDLARDDPSGRILRAERGPEVPAQPSAELRFRFSWDSWIWSRRGLDPSSLHDDVGLLSPGTRLGGLHEPAISHLPFRPLHQESSIYISGVFSLYQLDGKAGKGSVLREYRKPVAPDLIDHYVERSDAPIYTVTIWRRALEPDAPARLPDDVLLTTYVSDRVMAGNFMGYDITVEIPIRSLAAFDAGNGTLLWKTGKDRPLRAGRPVVEDAREELPEEDIDDEDVLENVFRRRGRLPPAARGPHESTEKEFSYTSPAIVRSGIVVAGGWIQRGYVRSMARGLDLRTGEVLWETLLSSSQLELTMFGEIAREPFSGAITEEDGVIYYSTQMGVIAALELETGRILWLTTYDSIDVQASLHRQAVRRRIGWGPNPLLVAGNVLFATPRDSETLLAIDTGRGSGGALNAGRVLWSVQNPYRHQQYGADLQDLLGYWRGFLYFSSPLGISALDLTGMGSDGMLPAGRIEPRRTRWPAQTQGVQVVAGAAALTSSGIVFCDGEGLRLASLDLKSVTDLTTRPLRRSDKGSYPGRIQVTPGLILMTSRQLISAFVPEPPALNPSVPGRR